MLIGSIKQWQAPYLKSFLFARRSEKSFSRTKISFQSTQESRKSQVTTFSHNLHLATHYILLTLNNIDQITTCRLFDSIQFCVCLIPRNAPHFFVSTSAIPDNRCLTEWVLSVKTRLLTDKLLILNNLSVKPHLFTDNLSILSQLFTVIGSWWRAGQPRTEKN